MRPNRVQCDVEGGFLEVLRLGRAETVGPKAPFAVIAAVEPAGIAGLHVAHQLGHIEQASASASLSRLDRRGARKRIHMSDSGEALEIIVR